jgi:hypothetical protein
MSMKIIDVFLSRPNWVHEHVEKQFSMFYPLLEEQGFRARTIGKDVVPLSTPFQHVVDLMNASAQLFWVFHRSGLPRER